MPLRVGVLASGRGSNFQALVDKKEAGKLPVEFAVLLVNNRDAGAIERAERHGIPWEYVDPAAHLDVHYRGSFRLPG